MFPRPPLMQPPDGCPLHSIRDQEGPAAAGALRVGQKVTGQVRKLEDRGCTVELEGGLVGFVPTYHLTNVPVKQLQTMFPVGKRIKCKVKGTMVCACDVCAGWVWDFYQRDTCGLFSLVCHFLCSWSVLSLRFTFTFTTFF